MESSISFVAPFLAERDLTRLLLVTRSIQAEFREDLDCLAGQGDSAKGSLCMRVTASRTLGLWWRKCVLLRWFDSLLDQVKIKHARWLQLDTNFSLRPIVPLWARWRLVDLKCPSCRAAPTEAAHFHYLPCSMRSMPILYVSCSACCSRDVGTWLPWGHVSYVATVASPQLTCFLDTID